MSVEAAAGLATALNSALDAAGPALPVKGAVAEQLALLPEGVRPDRASIDALPRGRGRPKGATNRRTTSWRDYLAGRYTHPLETLAVIQATPVDVLAAQLGCKPIEALAVIKSAAAELAPYMESKMPVGIAVGRFEDLGLLAIEGVTHSREEIGELIEGAFLTYAEQGGEMLEDQSLSEADREPLE